MKLEEINRLSDETFEDRFFNEGILPPAPAYVWDLAAEIQDRHDLPRVYIGLKRGGTVDAQSTPWGTVIVHDGILQRLDNEGLQGVLAHELAHLHLGHPQEHVARIDYLMGSLRGREYEADLQAAEWGYAEGLHAGLSQLAPLSRPGATATHPPIRERIHRLNTYLTDPAEGARLYGARTLDQRSTT